MKKKKYNKKIIFVIFFSFVLIAFCIVLIYKSIDSEKLLMTCETDYIEKNGYKGKRIVELINANKNKIYKEKLSGIITDLEHLENMKSFFHLLSLRYDSVSYSFKGSEFELNMIIYSNQNLSEQPIKIESFDIEDIIFKLENEGMVCKKN